MGMDDSLIEKELAELKLANDQSSESLRQTLDHLLDRTSSVLRFTLQWKDVEEHFGSVRNSLEARAKEVKAMEESVRRRLSEVEAREEEVGLFHDSIKVKLSELEKQRESDFNQALKESVCRWILELQLEELLSRLQAREKELGSLHESRNEKLSQLERIDKEFDLKRKAEIAKRRGEIELTEKRSKHMDSVRKSVDEKNEEFELKERKLEEWGKQLELKERELEERSRKELIRPQKESRIELGKRSAHDSLNPPAKKPTSLRKSNQVSRNKPSQGCEANGEKTVPSSEVEEVDNDSEASENYESHSLNPEFNDFDKTMSSFAVNQVWAMNDPHDDMPRFYAQIRKVFTSQNKLRVTWLKSLLVTQGEESIPVACGEFEYGETEDTEGHLMFLHQMHHVKSINNVFIYPNKGEIWALFRDWDSSWSTDLGKHKPPYKYDFVEVIHDLDNNFGVGVAYLGRVKGFVSVFERAEQHGIVAICIAPGEMQRFSHRVPSFRMTGNEKEGVPVGSFELDPAALSNYIFELHPHTSDAETKTCAEAHDVEDRSGSGDFISQRNSSKPARSHHGFRLS